MKRLLAILAALCLASSACAFSVSSVNVTPGFFTAGVRVFCSGDLDTTQTLVCQLYIRDMLRDDSRWSMGTQAFRRPGTTNAFDGIFIGLESGHRYGAMVTVKQGSNVAIESAQQYFATRIKTWNMGAGPQLFISPSGVNSGTCTSGSPCATLAYAQTQLDARVNHGIGGGIVMRPGVYRFTTSQATYLQIGYNIWNAKADSMYYLIGDGTNPDSTILDFTEEHSQTWVDGVNTTDSVWACKPVATNGVAMRADSIGWLVRGWGDAYPKKANLAELRYFVRVSGGTAGMSMGAPGWCWSPAGDSIYIKTPDGLSPLTETFHLGAGDGVVVGAKYWYFSNFTIRGGNANCITIGANVPPYTAVGCVFDSLTLIGAWHSSITGNGYVPTFLTFSDSTTIRNCKFLGLRAHMPHAAVFLADYHGHAVQFPYGGNHAFYNNTIIGHMTGIETWVDFTNATSDTTYSNDNYFGNNKIYDCVTDGFEAYTKVGGGAGGINMIFENNLVRSRASTSLDITNGGSLITESHRGPTWLIRNHFYGGHKVGLLAGGLGTANFNRVVLYHNTVVARGPALLASASYNLITSRNNVYVGHQESGENTYATVDCANAAATTKYDFDYDMVDSTANGAGMFRWGSTTPASLAFVQRSGVEAHGKQGAYSAVDSTRASAWPAAVTAGSAASVDAGVLIPGINTPLFGKRRYWGTAPDIGAYEWIAPTDSLNMPLNPNNKLWIKKP
jgi:hypothetical protein